MVERGYTKAEIASTFSVTVRTIERDLAKTKTKTNKGSATSRNRN